jgi:two-component system cell cycle response regulator DivK
VNEAAAEQAMEVILVVEDNKVSRQLVQTVLRPHGYCLLFAKDGQEAIKIARSKHPDLILMDLKLPGMSGYRAVRVLKSQPQTADIPIVALTAHAVGSERQRAADAGCEGYITKPIDTRVFADQLKQHMR